MDEEAGGMAGRTEGGMEAEDDDDATEGRAEAEIEGQSEEGMEEEDAGMEGGGLGTEEEAGAKARPAARRGVEAPSRETPREGEEAGENGGDVEAELEGGKAEPGRGKKLGIQEEEEAEEEESKVDSKEEDSRKKKQKRQKKVGVPFVGCWLFMRRARPGMRGSGEQDDHDEKAEEEAWPPIAEGERDGICGAEEGAGTRGNG